jgi:hypothetical protein
MARWRRPRSRAAIPAAREGTSATAPCLDDSPIGAPDQSAGVRSRETTADRPRSDMHTSAAGNFDIPIAFVLLQRQPMASRHRSLLRPAAKASRTMPRLPAIMLNSTRQLGRKKTDRSAS